MFGEPRLGGKTLLTFMTIIGFDVFIGSTERISIGAKYGVLINLMRRNWRRKEECLLERS
jgi:hypothetical protein